MNGNALDGFLSRTVPVARGEPFFGLPEWPVLIAGSGAALCCALLAAIAPSPESIERGWVIAIGAGLEATLAGLLRDYGSAVGVVSVLCLVGVRRLYRLPDTSTEALGFVALLGWIGSTVGLIGATALFWLIAALNVAVWIAAIWIALIVLGWLAG
jgi:hypothetical protein